jgi:hypothetical protein
MTIFLKAQLKFAVVPLTAMVLEPSNLFGYTKYLNLNLNLVSYDPD